MSERPSEYWYKKGKAEARAEIDACRNKALDEVMPEIMRVCSKTIIVGNVVNFETIRKAIDNLKHKGE